jgi:medium-chain acyl-[acyl-carrier-protein] hydrolase
LGGTDDPQVSRQDLAAWRTHTRGSFSFHMFPGSHFYLQDAQSLVLPVLAQDLKRVLRRLRQDHHGSLHGLPGGP